MNAIMPDTMASVCKDNLICRKMTWDRLLENWRRWDGAFISLKLVVSKMWLRSWEADSFVHCDVTHHWFVCFIPFLISTIFILVVDLLIYEFPPLWSFGFTLRRGHYSTATVMVHFHLLPSIHFWSSTYPQICVILVTGFTSLFQTFL